MRRRDFVKRLLGGCAATISASPIVRIVQRAIESRGAAPLMFAGVDLATSEDSSFITYQRFSREEIARIFQVPPHMLGDRSLSTYANAEKMFVWCSLPHAATMHGQEGPACHTTKTDA